MDLEMFVIGLYEPDYKNYQVVQLESGLLDLFFHYWCANKI